MDRIESMRLLLATLESGSISATSRNTGMPLATVSRKISELEAHLGTRLLNRTTRKLTLTDAGQPYALACKRILEELDAAERAATGEYSAPKGDLILTAPVLFGRLFILPIATEFLKAYPEIDLRLMLTDRNVNLIEEHIDLAVRIGELPDSSMVATRVGSSRQVVCASPAYLNARGTPETPQSLGSHDCITFESVNSAKTWSFIKGKTRLTVPVHSRLSVTTAEAAVDAAVAGIGITRILSYQVNFLDSDTLTLLLKDYESAPIPISVVYLGNSLLPQKLRAFLDFMTPRLKTRLQHR